MVSYAERLSVISDKGLCGDREIIDNPQITFANVQKLSLLIKQSNYCIIHTGAGISTSAGIADFRGPDGVWTCEAQNRPLPPSITFDEAMPTFTHKAINKLVESGLVKHVVTQNVDGLHIKSGLSRKNISEIHGCAFAEWCCKCRKEFRTEVMVPTIGLIETGNKCPICKTELTDLLCDWSSDLPSSEISRGSNEHKKADLVICCGTSLRIRPAGNWPMKTKRLNGKHEPGKIVIINLQKTHLDRECSLRIFDRTDNVFEQLMKILELKVE